MILLLNFSWRIFKRRNSGGAEVFQVICSEVSADYQKKYEKKSPPNSFAFADALVRYRTSAAAPSVTLMLWIIFPLLIGVLITCTQTKAAESLPTFSLHCEKVC